MARITCSTSNPSPSSASRRAEDRDFEKNVKDREALLQAAVDLVRTMQTPATACSNMGMSGLLFMAVRIAIEMMLFEKVVAAKSPLTTRQLALECGAEEQLVIRIGRTLRRARFLSGTTTADGSTVFFANEVTRHAIEPNVRAGFKFHFDQLLPVAQKAPEYFRRNGFQIPQGASKGLFNFASNTELDCYTYWAKEPCILENLNTFAKGYFGSRTLPIDWFPYDEVCLNGFNPKSGCEYVWVELGGNKGYNLQALVDKYPDAKGKFLLQDLPSTMEDVVKSNVKLSYRIAMQGYDFFTPQPVKGARTYCLENVLHNWNNEHCQRILTNVRDAMTPGYSKLLISTLTVPDQDTPLELCGVDLLMLCLEGGGQRSEKQWHDLVGGVGLSIVKIWPPPGIGNAVIEVVRMA